MVGFAIQHRPLQCLASGNGHAVFELLDCSSHGPQLAGHYGEAIGFLHAQFLRIPDAADPLGDTGRHRQHRNFIHEPGNQIPADLKGLERSVGDPQVSDRFSCHIPAAQDFNAGPHLLQHLQDPGATGIEAHVLHREIRPRRDRTGYQPKGRRADITRHHHRLAPQMGPGPHDYLGAAWTPHAEVGAKGPQHAFAVVPRLGGFNHGGGTLSGERCQQDRALHLGGSHRGVHRGAHEPLASNGQGGVVAPLAALDLGTHLGEGTCHPPHGPSP